MIAIIPYEKKYKEDVRNILIGASLHPQMSEEQKRLRYLLYNDYYTEFEPDNIFLAFDEDLQKPVGYIIGSSNLDLYEEKMKAVFLPEAEKIEPARRQSVLNEIAAYRQAEALYPVHMHIDLLPESQGKQIGAKLLTAFEENLRRKGKQGIVLGVSRQRPNAIKFYKKNGFNIVSEDETGFGMGKTLPVF